MPAYSKGQYQVVNSQKYVGNKMPIWRSSWELTFCQFCDNNPAVIQWASEPVMIPYFNPLTGRNTVYIPDFLIVYVDKNGKRYAELIEIKPLKETNFQSAKSARDKAMVAVNLAKWQAARAWCQAHGLKMRVVTENDIFIKTGKK